jgi:hypothetical protein
MGNRIKKFTMEDLTGDKEPLKQKSMEKLFKVLPPIMPNFVRFEKELGLREDGFKVNKGFSINNFTIDEAYEYAELMKQTFIKHWEEKQINK